jgi:hypothetical protein
VNESRPFHHHLRGRRARRRHAPHPQSTGRLGGTPQFTFSAHRHRLADLRALSPSLGNDLALSGPVTSGEGHYAHRPDWAELEWAATVIVNAIDPPAASYQFSAGAIAPVLIAHAPR